MLVAPYPLARLSLADDVTLDLVALPLVPAYAPLWPLYLAGAHALIVLDEAARQPLDAVCDERGILRVEAGRSLGPPPGSVSLLSVAGGRSVTSASGNPASTDDISVSVVASLVRRALER